MNPKHGVSLGLGALLIGLLAGYLIWGLPTERLKARVAEEAPRTTEMQSRVAEVESQLKRLVEELKVARETQQQLEEIVARGRK